MTLFRNLIMIPYKFIWKLLSLFNRTSGIDFLCGNIVDYFCFRPVHKLMPKVRIVARNRRVQKDLKSIGIDSVLYPTFPKVIIIARHLTRKFPVKEIVKIGMRHGAYHFKDFVSKDKYNAFDSFFVTSKKEVEIAKTKSITSCKAIGFPKIDPMFNGEIGADLLLKTKKSLNIDDSKPIILFTATWNKSSYSAINRWYDKLDQLTEKYNILVTVHQWTTKEVKDKVIATKGIKYLSDKDILKYLMIADLMVGDTSSIIAEFCSLDKPIITFELPEYKRFTSEIITMLKEISFRVETFDQLLETLPIALKERGKHKKFREKYNKIMFDDLDGRASERARDQILKMMR
ncbi:MAG: hypothetical protein CR982_02315 [Candidatus Cloacimonadota bacterium]|nr:MAG: hypothetical protein CR982_02315 [Candidatus Cloacimonadota bacterium]PIE81094.1 MAG: hypothetical protein CSA15_01075 [Candidatus Delongbacteria bacterium]